MVTPPPSHHGQVTGWGSPPEFETTFPVPLQGMHGPGSAGASCFWSSSAIGWRRLALIASSEIVSEGEPVKATPRLGAKAQSRGMFFVRYVLPGLIMLSGLLLGLIDGRALAWEAGALLISAGLSVYLLNFLFRLGVRGDRARDREEAAREHFDRTGRWPGE
jgi:hypothetical protein